ncbi:MAG: cytochrome c biogenesis protein ResB [Thermoanaerobacterales bacterium]|nr:cytochrome c biogenesis protein ResB [Thermoanaerobacterales bacterium]
MESRRAFPPWAALGSAVRWMEALLAGPRWSIAFGTLLLSAAVFAGFFGPDGGASLLAQAVAGKTAEPARGLGVSNLARARWFVGLEVLLLLGLSACLLRRVFEALHDLRWPVLLETPEQIGRCAWSRSLFYPDTSARWAIARQEAALRARDWAVRVLDGDGGAAMLYAEYWRWGRLSSLMLHTGVLLVVAAGIMAPFMRTVERVETVAYRTLPLSEKGFRYDVQIGDLALDPVQDGKTPDCRVSVAVVDRGLQLPPHEVRAGSPLHHRGMTIYLGDCGRIVDLRIRDGDEERLLSVRDGGRVNLPGADGRVAVRLSPDLNYVACEVGNGEGMGAAGRVRAGETVRIGRTSLAFVGQRPYAVLVVKREAGAGLALAGAVMFLGGFILGQAMRLRRVWAVAGPGNGGASIHLGGDTPGDETALVGPAGPGSR